MSTTAVGQPFDPNQASLVLTRTEAHHKIMFLNGKQYLVEVVQEDASGQSLGIALQGNQWDKLIPTIQRLMVTSHEIHDKETSSPDLESRKFSISLSYEPEIIVYDKEDKGKVAADLTKEINIYLNEIKLPISLMKDIQTSVYEKDPHLTFDQYVAPSDLKTTQTRGFNECNKIEKDLETVEKDLIAARKLSAKELKKARQLDLQPATLDRALHTFKIPNSLEDPSIFIVKTLKLADFRTETDLIKHLETEHKLAYSDKSIASSVIKKLIIPILIPSSDPTLPDQYACYFIDKNAPDGERIYFYHPEGKKEDFNPSVTMLRNLIGLITPSAAPNQCLIDLFGDLGSDTTIQSNLETKPKNQFDSGQRVLDFANYMLHSDLIVKKNGDPIPQVDHFKKVVDHSLKYYTTKEVQSHLGSCLNKKKNILKQTRAGIETGISTANLKFNTLYRNEPIPLPSQETEEEQEFVDALEEQEQEDQDIFEEVEFFNNFNM